MAKFMETLWKIISALLVIAFVLLIILVLILDVLLGAIGILTQVNYGPPVGLGYMAQWFIAACASLAGTGIRFAVWEMHFSGVRPPLSLWVLAMCMIVMNTLLDVGAVAHLFFHADNGQIFIAGNGAFELVAVVVAAVCAMDCVITLMAVKWLNKELDLSLPKTRAKTKEE